MNAIRRNVLKGAGGIGALPIAVAAGLLKPAQVLADWNQAGFTAIKADDALAAIGATETAESMDIIIQAPEIAENGSKVPLEITINIPDVQFVAILSEKNINPLVCEYNLTDFDGFLSTRIKMASTANVRAIVKAGGKVYTAAKEVKVTVGGCGG